MNFKVSDIIELLDTEYSFSFSKKVDLLISSDFKYHDIQLSLENNLNIVDLGHFESEIFGLLSLKEFLISKNVDLKILLYENNIFKRNIF